MSDSARYLDLVVAGNIALDDTILPGARCIENAPGGDALYAAIGARLWGIRVGIFSRVGEDYPEWHLEEIQRAGIDISGIRRCTGPTVHYRILYESANDRQFIHITPPRRLAELSPERADLPTAYRSAAVYHLAAMPTLLQAVLFADFIQRGATVSLDPYEEDVAEYIDALLGMFHQGMTFLPSELEVGLIADVLGNTDSRRDPFEAAAWFCEQGCRLVSIKLGNMGSLTRLANDERLYRLPALPTQVVDPTGAGDAFCGGFLAGMIRYSSPLLAAACGTVSASLVIEDFGAMHTLRPLQQERDQRLYRLLSSAGLERSSKPWQKN
jgi:sugar/nucleoside kinase (ribokinase family)